MGILDYLNNPKQTTTMKILKEGRVIHYKQECEECGCIFEYTHSDISDDNVMETIYCPYCHEVLYPEWKEATGHNKHGYVMLLVCGHEQEDDPILEASSVVFDTREEAENCASDYPECVAIAEVNWEE